MRTPREVLTRDMQAAVEMVNLPGGDAEFQQRLLKAEQTDSADADALARLISLAHAAHVVAATCDGSTFSPWYHDMAQRLLRKCADVLAIMEASRGIEPGITLN